MEGLWPTLIQGDCRAVLPTLESESVHCCVTSPPYWGLRDYGTATWEGCEEGCDHLMPPLGGQGKETLGGSTAAQNGTRLQQYRDRCGKCGARRIDSQIGLEPTPEAHIEALLAVFREVWRVLRKDGTLWVNYGDCFRDKQLLGLSWRLAFALQADGWYLRSDIIWAKANPLPESVQDRPTRSHEYLFLLSKQPRYFYDADAIREPNARDWTGSTGRNNQKWDSERRERETGLSRKGSSQSGFRDALPNPAGRNRRTVWEIATQPTPEAHFATFPAALVEPCVMAGTSECGCCPECGAPWARVVEKSGGTTGRSWQPQKDLVAGLTRNEAGGQALYSPYATQTVGWRPTCAHPHSEQDLQAALVLDPFAGSGTVCRVATRLGRRSVGIELSDAYVTTVAGRRNAQGGLGL